jgi:hypothetical protein
MRRERRQEERITVSWRVVIATAHGSMDGEVKNIGRKGALLHSKHLPNLDEVLRLTIDTTHHGQAKVDARIVRLDIYDDDPAVVTYGLGIKFRAPTEEDRKVLDSAISSSVKPKAQVDSFKETSTIFLDQLKEGDLIVDALYRCLGEKDEFNSRLFRSHIETLSAYHERVAPLLLGYLKRSKNRRGRVALINVLPELYTRIDGPKTIVRELLDEFCLASNKINLYDRNLLMLASQLLRHYRKEEGLDIEATPEEVLRVQKGLVPETVELARRTVSMLEPKIRSKAAGIYATLMASLAEADRNKSTKISPRFLILLLREFYILLALIGGPEAKAILRENVLAISNPESPAYKDQPAKRHLNDMLGLFRIGLRGYLRLVTNPLEEYDHLDTVKNRIHSLQYSLAKRYHPLLQQILGLINQANERDNRLERRVG